MPVPEKRSNFLKVCQIRELEPEKLIMESPEVGKKSPINIQQLEEKPIWNGPENWQKMSRKKLLSSLYMWHFKLCALLMWCICSYQNLALNCIFSGWISIISGLPSVLWREFFSSSVSGRAGKKRWPVACLLSIFPSWVTVTHSSIPIILRTPCISETESKLVPTVGSPRDWGWQFWAKCRDICKCKLGSSSCVIRCHVMVHFNSSTLFKRLAGDIFSFAVVKLEKISMSPLWKSLSFLAGLEEWVNELGLLGTDPAAFFQGIESWLNMAWSESQQRSCECLKPWIYSKAYQWVP